SRGTERTASRDRGSSTQEAASSAEQLVALHDLQDPTAQLMQPGDQLPGLTAVGPHQPHPGALRLRPGEDRLGPVAILDRGGVDHGADQQTRRIDQQMPFGPLDFLAGIVGAEATGAAALDRLAIDDRGGRFVLLALVPPHSLTQGVEESLPDPGATPAME